jgi:lysophospholipase L1-like esterase
MASILRVRDNNGNIIGIPSLQGEKGDSPVKGTDYWTETDQQIIKNDSRLYITEVLADKAQLMPLFVSDIAECTDTSRLYVLPDGYIYAYTLNPSSGVEEWMNTNHQFVSSDYREKVEELDNKMATVYADDCSYVNYNKFIESEATTGVYINASGNIAANSSYNMTGYIPCRTGKYLYVSSYSKSGVSYIRGIEFFDANKNRLFFSAETSPNQGGLFDTISVKQQNELTVRYSCHVTIEDCHYVRIVYDKTIQPTLVIEVRDFSSYSALDIAYTPGKKISPALEVNPPYWRGKTILWLGDSITNGYGSQYNTAFPEFVQWNLECTSVNEAIDGGALAVKATDETLRTPLVDNYINITDEVDAVCVAIGSNDWNYDQSPFGNMTSSDKYTFYGALKILCEGLMKKYLGKPIVFFTPIKRFQASRWPYYEPNAHGKTLEDYANAIKEVCGYYGIPVLDLYNECMLNPLIPEVKEAYIPDGVHPNIHGHKILARRITGYLKQLADGIF